MLTRRLTPFLLLACALLAPTMARADSVVRVPAHVRGARLAQAAAVPDPATDPQIAQWMAVAQAHWGAAPNCPTGISIQRAQWLPDPGVWAAAIQGGCAMAFDPDFYPAPAGYDGGWYQAAMCSVVAHEWGHLLGYGHVADPNNLMSPVTPINIVGGCPTWGLSSATSNPAPAPTQPPTQATKTTSKKTAAKKKARSTCAGKAKSRSSKRVKAPSRCKATAKKRRAKKRG